jgi:hypothetical protein
MQKGEIGMWQAVINRAIADAIDEKLCESKRTEALDWIYNGGPYFEQACDFANVTPDAVRMELLRKKTCRAVKNH